MLVIWMRCPPTAAALYLDYSAICQKVRLTRIARTQRMSVSKRFSRYRTHTMWQKLFQLLATATEKEGEKLMTQKIRLDKI